MCGKSHVPALVILKPELTIRRLVGHQQPRQAHAERKHGRLHIKLLVDWKSPTHLEHSGNDNNILVTAADD